MPKCVIRKFGILKINVAFAATRLSAIVKLYFQIKARKKL